VPLIKVNGTDTWDLIAGRPRYYSKPFPYERTTVSSAFWLAVMSCGINDLHLHDLRAGAISKLFELGIGIPLVALISGHRNWKVLQRHYSRVAPGAVHAAIASAGA
jgi:integrase